MKITTLCLTLFCAAALLLQPQISTAAVQEGLRLCAETLIPALFPFLVLSGLLIRLGFAHYAARLLSPFMARLFHLNGAGAGALLLGLVGGYPVGARAVLDLYRQSLCPKEDCERLLAFCNNSGPAFLLSVAGLGIFGDLRAGLWLYLIHVLSALLVGILLRGKKPPQDRGPAPIHTASFSAALTQSVTAATGSMLQICAFALVFLVLLRLIGGLFPPQPGETLLRPLLLGFFELTQGVCALPPSRGGFLLCAFLAGWGGLSVHCQTMALLQESGLSLGWYFPGKLLQGLFSLFLAELVLFLFG